MADKDFLERDLPGLGDAYDGSVKSGLPVSGMFNVAMSVSSRRISHVAK